MIWEINNHPYPDYDKKVEEIIDFTKSFTLDILEKVDKGVHIKYVKERYTDPWQVDKSIFEEIKKELK